ncbi:hypothetical protein [Vagococcus allomyrinae]|nr:hypothetical protein [Vagococcus allomyrinae]
MIKKISTPLLFQKGNTMSVFEALTLATSLAMLVIAILKFNQDK